MCSVPEQVALFSSQLAVQRHYVSYVPRQSQNFAYVLTQIGSENRIVHWVKCIIEEAYAVVDFDDEHELTVPDEPFQLGLAVLHIWCRFLQGNTQWQFVNNLGISLEKYTKTLT